MATKSKKGFTIIEVVLVLAIAGLIFLMVFIALPNMQRSQRDTQRRNDYSALSANMTSYITNNNGRLPQNDFVAGDAAKYINDDGEDPNGFTYDLHLQKCESSSGDYCGLAATNAVRQNATRDAASTVYVITNAVCNDGTPVYSASRRSFAIFGNFETGNGSYCQSNS